MAGTMWRDGARRGIAYVENRETAAQVLEMAGVKSPVPTLATAAVVIVGTMAVYSDRKGRPFAWQIPFPIGQWEQVAALVGAGAGEAAAK